ncbi:hypothetical protein F4859DRAFT_366203 [Xylaria cf. heliscus]|nr:hypothetical protein F4859DRAFT_366203 [Xylaria cf. heliscus]
MSTSPEDHDQGGSPHPAGESSHTNGRTNGLYHADPIPESIEHDEENPANGVAHQGGQGAHGYNTADNEGTDSDVKNAGPLSAVRQNTPASTENTPGPAAVSGPSPASIASAVAALVQQGSGTQVGGTSAHGELNRVNGTGTPSTTGGSPSPPPPSSPPPPPSPPPQQPLPVSQSSPSPSPSSTSSNPQQHSTSQESSAGQAENAGTGAQQPGPSPSPGGSSSLISHQGSQTNTEGQNDSDETRGSENSGNNSPGENEAAVEGDQVPVTSQQDDSLNQQSSRGIPSLDAASDADGGEVTTNPSTSQGGFQPQQHDEPDHGSGSSTQLDPSHALRPSQLPGPAPTPPAAQAPGSSSMNPIAPSFVPRPEQPDAPQSITLPTWQPDTEVTHCPICGVRFSIFLRRHHCRKCGRVVCDGCSPHRITIPHPYIVRPPGDPGPALQFSYPGVERGIADFNSIGGGERVRLCNPCVPDPNTAPPQPQQSPRPIVVDGRASRANPSNRLFGNYSVDARPYLQHPQLPPQGYTPSRNRSATSAGHGQEYLSFIPYSSTSSQFPPPNAAYFSQTPIPHRRVSSSGLIYPPHIDPFGRLHGSSSSGFAPSFPGLNRPLPRTPTPEPEIPEEDVCPVCHRELPSRSLPNYEALREIHINNCITSHSNYRGDQAVTATGTGNHGTPPPRTTRRTRMFPYVATEKDCVGDVECTICLEEFKVGDQMARLECFCRFHRSCIDSWFVNRPGRCPIHQHDSFGY